MKIIKSSTDSNNMNKIRAVEDAILDAMESSGYDIEDFKDLVKTAAKKLIQMNLNIDINNIECSFEKEPIDVAVAELEINLGGSGKTHHIFLVYDEDIVYINEMPEIYADTGLVDPEHIDEFAKIFPQ